MVTVVSMFTKFLVYLGYIVEAFKIAVSVFLHFQTSPIDKTLQLDLSSHKSFLKVEMIGIVCSSFWSSRETHNENRTINFVSIEENVLLVS